VYNKKLNTFYKKMIISIYNYEHITNTITA